VQVEVKSEVEVERLRYQGGERHKSYVIYIGKGAENFNFWVNPFSPKGFTGCKLGPVLDWIGNKYLK
jgi:hypothetical protein